MAKFESDVQAAHNLCRLFNDLTELCSDVRDTMYAVGKEADNATQQVRAIVKAVARTKPTPGLKLLAQRLNPRPVRPAGKETPESPPPPDPAPTSDPSPAPAVKAA